jgi:hypothetical protein
MRHLIRICEDGSLDGPFWVDSVLQTGNEWLVVEGYWGSPDKSGAATKCIHHIFTDDHGALTNMVTELHFR